MSISLVEVVCEDDNSAGLFHAIHSMTILKVFNCFGFFHPRKRYQFSPWVDVTIIWRPEGSKNILYMEKSEDFRWIGTLATCSGCDSSINRIKLFDRPMTRTSEEITRETIGAGGSNWTGSRSNIGVLADSGPANWFPSYS